MVKAGRRIARAIVKKGKDLNLTEVEVQPQDLEGKVLAKPLIDESTGEIIADANKTGPPPDCIFALLIIIKKRESRRKYSSHVKAI